MALSETFRQRARATLPPEVMRDLVTIGAVAQRQPARVLLVGGAVRDVLLERPTRDLDLVVAGEVGGCVDALAAALGGVVVAESRFRTFRVELAGDRRLDVVAARRESYESPAALPVVSPGSLADDLARRDFTINAMAVELGERWGEVIDPHDGHCDLEAGRVRVLHGESFLDDPTRVLRAIELAVRLGFEVEPATATQARAALAGGVLDRLSRVRWRTAWRRAFGAIVDAGRAPLRRGLELGRELGLLAALDGRITLDANLRRWVDELAAGASRWQGLDRARLLMRLLAGDEAGVARALAVRWAPMGKEVRAWESFSERRRRLTERLEIASVLLPSEIGDAFSGFDVEELALLELAPDGAATRALEVFRSRVLPTRLGIGGRHLLMAGYEAGPRIGRVLEATLRARIDGRISAAGELEYACAALEASSE